MDNSETSEPMDVDDVSSSVEDKTKRKNPFVQSDDEEEDDSPKVDKLEDAAERRTVVLV